MIYTDNKLEAMLECAINISLWGLYITDDSTKVKDLTNTKFTKNMEKSLDSPTLWFPNFLYTDINFKQKGKISFFITLDKTDFHVFCKLCVR
jgi:hypothetical protein